MNYNLEDRFLPNILLKEDRISVSVYMETHRSSPDNQQDRIRFKNLLQDVKKKLSLKFQKNDVEKIVISLNELLEDENFWNSTYDGLAVFINSKDFLIYKLQTKVENMVYISETFYIKPLVKYYQELKYYYILQLNKKNFQLYKGNRFSLNHVKLDSLVVNDIDRFFKEEGFDREKDFKKGLDKFYEYIDDFVNENYTAKYDNFLILSGNNQNQSIFRKISKNKNLLKKGIDINSGEIDINQMMKKFEEIIIPEYEEKIEKLINVYYEKFNKLKTTSNLLEIGRALYDNKLDTLIVDEGCFVSGVIENNGTVKTESTDGEKIEKDLINDLIILSFKFGAKIFVLEAKNMPKDIKYCAILRH